MTDARPVRSVSDLLAEAQAISNQVERTAAAIRGGGVNMSPTLPPITPSQPASAAVKQPEAPGRTGKASISSYGSGARGGVGSISGESTDSLTARTLEQMVTAGKVQRDPKRCETFSLQISIPVFCLLSKVQY